jgi:hypothetical protein
MPAGAGTISRSASRRLDENRRRVSRCFHAGHCGETQTGHCGETYIRKPPISVRRSSFRRKPQSSDFSRRRRIEDIPRAFDPRGERCQRGTGVVRIA